MLAANPVSFLSLGGGQDYVLNSINVMELDVVSSHLILTGGRYIGLELAQMFLRFGSAVTVVHGSAELLGKEEPNIADAVPAVLVENDIDILVNAHATSITESGANNTFLSVSINNATRTLTASHIIATASTPTRSRSPPPRSPPKDPGSSAPTTASKATTLASTPSATSEVDRNSPVSYADFRIVRHNLFTHPSPNRPSA